jgi:hypothetical protein
LSFGDEGEIAGEVKAHFAKLQSDFAAEQKEKASQHCSVSIGLR